MFVNNVALAFSMDDLRIICMLKKINVNKCKTSPN